MTAARRRRARAQAAADDAVSRSCDQALEHRHAAERAEQRVDRVLGVRHQAEHVALDVRDTGDTVARAVHVLARSAARPGPARSTSAASASSATQLPSPCLIGMTSARRACTPP